MGFEHALQAERRRVRGAQVQSLSSHVELAELLGDWVVQPKLVDGRLDLGETVKARKKREKTARKRPR